MYFFQIQKDESEEEEWAPWADFCRFRSIG